MPSAIMRKGIYLLIILLFPSIAYLLFSLGEHHVERLGFYGDHIVTAEGDTAYRPVPDLALEGAGGTAFSIRELEGKIVVLDVFDWPCEETCRKKAVTLANYLSDVEEKEKWVVLSLCKNPDVPAEELSELASKPRTGGLDWRFAKVADEKEAERFLGYVFVQTGKVASLQALPSVDFVLLDRELRLRAFFDSRIYKENKKMEDAIRLLIQEPFISWKGKTN